MTGTMTNPKNFRTIQVFLSPGLEGVAEVSQEYGGKRLHCTCPGYTARSKCPHIRFVAKRIEEGGGKYHLTLKTGANADEAVLAGDDHERFRQFVLRSARVEVL